jgi:protein SOK2
VSLVERVSKNLHSDINRANKLDNHMINGTKLLNVAGMTRGRRDGILKSEKMRHVVKIGPMHLKGVW